MTGVNPSTPPPGPQWQPRTAPLGPPAAPVPPGYPAPLQPAAPPADHRRAVIVLAAAVAVAVMLVVGTIAYLAGRTSSSTTAAAAATKAPVPVISNIPRPDVACQPWSEWEAGKVVADEVDSAELFVGYIDGERQEMLVARVALLGIQGHRLEYVWACPPRSQWTTAG